MKNSTIAWTDHTFNPWVGCEKISAGCAHCYAETMMATRFQRVRWGRDGTRERTSPANWRQPLKWNQEAQELGLCPRVFCASLADVFEDRDELVPWRDDLHRMIAQTPHLIWLLLTKRPEVAARYYRSRAVPTNVWLGTTVENRAAIERIPTLAAIPAAVHFLSCEPLLEDLGTLPLQGIEWLIAGGESGRDHRPVEAAWLRSLRDQCRSAGLPFFFKQWGGVRPKQHGNVLDDEVIEQVPVPGRR